MNTDNITIKSLGSTEMPKPNFDLEAYLKDTESPVFEIAPGMTAEEMTAMFFAKDALIEAPEKVYRLNASGHRYYYTFREDGQPQFFVSVTTFIKQTMPTSPILLKWIAETGYSESQVYAQERASYGTFMHAQIAELLITGRYDLNSVKARLRDYIEKEQLPSNFINYAEDLKKDILAFAQFAIETNLKPIAIELVLTHPRDGYAGAMDLACEFDAEISGYFGEFYKTGANAGKERKTTKIERVRAIIDFKSGRKGFFEEHEVQLHAYKEMWNLHFPSTPIQRVFNWSPKDWRGTTPTYNLKDQTDSPNAKKLPYLVELARIEDDKRDNTVVLCSGAINLETTKDLTGNISEFTLSEIVKKKTERKEEKPSADKAFIVKDLTESISQVQFKPNPDVTIGFKTTGSYKINENKDIAVIGAITHAEVASFINDEEDPEVLKETIKQANEYLEAMKTSGSSQDLPVLTANSNPIEISQEVKAVESPKEEVAQNAPNSLFDEIDF